MTRKEAFALLNEYNKFYGKAGKKFDCDIGTSERSARRNRSDSGDTERI